MTNPANWKSAVLLFPNGFCTFRFKVTSDPLWYRRGFSRRLSRFVLFFLYVAAAAGGQFRPEVSAPLCQRGICADVQETHQVGEGRRGHEGGAGQVQVAVRGCGRHAHRGGGEDTGEKERSHDFRRLLGDCRICSDVSIWSLFKKKKKKKPEKKMKSLKNWFNLKN